MRTEIVRVNIVPGGVPAKLHVSQYDVGFRTFNFVPYDEEGGVPYVEGASVTIEATKPDNHAVINNCLYNDTGTVTYTLQQQLAAVPGTVWSKLVFRDTNGDVLATAAVLWIVDRAGVTDDAIASDSDMSALQEFVQEFGGINAYKQKLDAVAAAIGGPNAAATAAEMTDEAKVYVYTGETSGDLVYGHWYYYDEGTSAWVDGGVYNAAAVETDKTLTVENVAADGKATGDAITALDTKVDAGLAALLADVAPLYSASGTYAVGDYATQGGKIYKCVTAIETAEEWTAAHWTEVVALTDLGARLTELKNEIDSFGLTTNVLPDDYYSGDTLTNNGITFTRNADGTVSSAGTATEQARYYWVNGYEIPAGEYYISGIPNDAGERSFGLQYAVVDTGVTPSNANYTRISSPATIQIADGKTLYMRTWYYNGYVDEGHTWAVTISGVSKEISSKYNARNFVPIIYDNQEKLKTVADISEAKTETYFDATFEIGTIKTTGAPGESTTRVFSTHIPISEPTTVKIRSGYQAAFFYYPTATATGSTRYDAWVTDEFTIPAEQPYFRYVVQKVPAETVQSDEIETYAHAVYVPSDIPIVQQVAKIAGMEEDIDVLKQYVDTDTLPDYWKTYLESKKTAIDSELLSIGNHGIAFAFFTDYHLPQSDFQYYDKSFLPLILEYIKSKCYIDNVIFGGDILTNNPTQAEAIGVLERYRDAFANIGVKNIIGNHETNPYGSGGDSEKVTLSQLYPILGSAFDMEHVVNYNPDMYWYYDNAVQKVRIIAPNTHELGSQFEGDTAQVQWLINTLNSTPDGYVIAFMPHLFFNVSEGQVVIGTVGTLLENLLTAYTNRSSGTWASVAYDFSNAKGKIAFVLAGHAHNDASFMSENGYPLIGTVCDAVNGSNQSVTRTRRSITEHAVDIVFLDTAAKTVKLLRIGSGEDRTFSYA